MLRRLFALGVMLVATLAIAGQAAPAAAAGYPDKPVKIIFPNAAGSANELSILAITAKLKGVVPVPIAVVAMPGAGTAAGTRFVASQPADGYTMLFIHEAPLQTSALGMLGFDFLDKFEPLVRVNSAFPADYARADAPCAPASTPGRCRTSSSCRSRTCSASS
jgi:tripartite-type tricarboxylate transporter receptor subunit TctC